jgi:hypothetical protein
MRCLLPRDEWDSKGGPDGVANYPNTGSNDW